MMSLTFDLFTQVSGSGPLGPLVKSSNMGKLKCILFFFSFLTLKTAWVRYLERGFLRSEIFV